MPIPLPSVPDAFLGDEVEDPSAPDDVVDDADLEEDGDGEEHDGDGSASYMLKPYAGENMTDLLTNVAGLNPKLAAAIEAIVRQDSLDEAAKALLAYMAYGPYSHRDALKDLKEKLEFPEQFGFEYTDHETRGSDRMVRVRDPRATGEIVLVLNADTTGVYIGQVQDMIRDTFKVKFLSGAGDAAVNDVAAPYVAHVGETHDVFLTYSEYDDTITETVTKDEVLQGMIVKIDPVRGVMVSGQLPNGKLFREWLDCSRVSGFANEAF